MLKALIPILKQTALTFTLCALLTACGKRTPPVPPVERVLQKPSIGATQRGNRVLISWITPARNAGSGSVLNIDRIDIFRLAEPLDSPVVLTEEEFSAKSTLIGTVQIGESDFGRKEMVFEDPLSFAGQKARLRYAARYANKSGQKAGYSNFILIEPAARVSEAPTAPALELSQEQVLVKWTAPGANVDGSTPPNILGYNVYRAEDKALRKLNAAPVTGTEFADRFFDFGRKYRYSVRAVSLGTNAEPVESLDSPATEIEPKDVFAPAAPSALTIAAAPNQISIFFASNVETDIAGYRVYRSTVRGTPLDKWQLLTPVPITPNTYQDGSVESGRSYFYYVTAIDRTGNVSAPSEIVGDTVP